MRTILQQKHPEEHLGASGRQERAGQFAKGALITISARILTLILGIATSIVIARLLGPEGKGIYTLAALLPALIVTFANLGIGPATVYYVAQRRYPRQEILGNNIIFAVGIGAVGVLGGLIVALFFHQGVFPGVAQGYLLLALALIPVTLLFAYLQSILLGVQRLKEFNLIAILHAFLFLAFIVIALWILKAGITGALLAAVVAWFLTDVVLLLWARKVAGGISFNLNPTYLRKASTYGVQVHLGNILGFLNYRIDMFLVNGFLNPAAVGFYSIGVGLVEKLWLVSHAASTVLFPRVAAESDEQRRKEFTPIIARTVLWVTALGALAIFFLSRWIVESLYSVVFLPAVEPLQILLLGIVALSVGRVLANDIAGRGRVMLNNYAGSAIVATNVVLNIWWIPRYGIAGAAWASTVSYGLGLVMMLFLYCRLSDNPWTKVLFPQRGDWPLYRRTGVALGQWVKARGKGLCFVKSRMKGRRV
ncbi:flippase [Thermodesulfovibrionales bacterium]|nr:flippase [Thermodesulfovibrionales bacterium]